MFNDFQLQRRRAAVGIPQRDTGRPPAVQTPDVFAVGSLQRLLNPDHNRHRLFPGAQSPYRGSGPGKALTRCDLFGLPAFDRFSAADS